MERRSDLACIVSAVDVFDLGRGRHNHAHREVVSNRFFKVSSQQAGTHLIAAPARQAVGVHEHALAARLAEMRPATENEGAVVCNGGDGPHQVDGLRAKLGEGFAETQISHENCLHEPQPRGTGTDNRQRGVAEGRATERDRQSVRRVPFVWTTPRLPTTYAG